MSSPVINVYLDYQYPTDLFSAKFCEQDTTIIRCWLYCYKEKFQPIADHSAVLAYTTEFENNTSPITITGEISTEYNYVDFTLPSTITRGDYFSQVAIQNNNTSKQYVMGYGKLSVKRKAGVA